MAFYLILISLIILTGISVYNYFTAPRLYESNLDFKEMPLVSILIPTRNEEKNICECIDSIVNQSYKNFEIIVLDDNSTDKTWELISSYCKKNCNVRSVSGAKLKTGWTGKNWACHQLVQYAQGELLLFIDADVRLTENALKSVLSKLYKYNVPFISVFPKLLSKSFGEQLVIPLVNWFLLSFLPLKKVYSSNKKSISAANGQFILIRKEIYFKIGGHERICGRLVEDMELVRNCKAEGYPALTLLGGNLVICRMYEGLISSFEGFSKNLFPGFNVHAVFFGVFLVIAELIFLTPIILMFFYPQFLICTVLILTGRTMISITSGGEVFSNLVLHPLQMVVFFALGINSVYVKYSGKVSWKGRKY